MGYAAEPRLLNPLRPAMSRWNYRSSSNAVLNIDSNHRGVGCSEERLSVIEMLVLRLLESLFSPHLPRSRTTEA